MELTTKASMPVAARKICAAIAPLSSAIVGAPTCIAMGSEDSGVFIYDISTRPTTAIALTKLQGA